MEMEQAILAKLDAIIALLDAMLASNREWETKMRELRSRIERSRH